MIQSTLYKLLNIISIILKLFKICTLCYLFHYNIYIYIYIQCGIKLNVIEQNILIILI